MLLVIVVVQNNNGSVFALFGLIVVIIIIIPIGTLIVVFSLATTNKNGEDEVWLECRRMRPRRYTQTVQSGMFAARIIAITSEEINIIEVPIGR